MNWTWLLAGIGGGRNRVHQVICYVTWAKALLMVRQLYYLLRSWMDSRRVKNVTFLII